MAEETISQETAAFDWDALSLDGYTKAERSELSEKYENTLNSIKEKEVVQGVVTSITKKKLLLILVTNPKELLHPMNLDMFPT